MKTVTFYSYKGGVGRSLALVNIASRLIEFGKSVCLLDFDLEAPGLNCKFGYDTEQIKKGIVDYVYDFANNGTLNQDIRPYTVRIPDGTNNPMLKPSYLIPAGNSHSQIYWKKLSAINWYDLIYENEDGIAFLLDLKEKIETQLKPDYLLIDSRTGISEISGIALSLMAEEVVVLAANNKENLEGVSKIIKGLKNSTYKLTTSNPSITFVLSRIPFTEAPEDRLKEISLIRAIKNTYLKDLIQDINVIHSDRDLEENESIKIGYDKNDKTMPQISRDYMLLFEKVVKDSLTSEEIQRFENIMKANQIWFRSQDQNLTSPQKIELLNKAIELAPNHIFIISRIRLLQEIEQFDQAIKDIHYIRQMNPNDPVSYVLMGELLSVQGEYQKAMSEFEKANSLHPNEMIANLGLANSYYFLGMYDEAINTYERLLNIGYKNYLIFNGIATSFRKKKLYEKALEYIYQALSLSPSAFIARATLAEIKASQGVDEEFLFHFEQAIIAANMVPRGKLMLEKSVANENDVYSKYEENLQFKTILDKYNFNYKFDEVRIKINDFPLR